ncbi:tRNA1(Val) (adenine(37)-N6)-methyltransferase [uncultured Desulfuromusa sp.]|uniref:tRNA1(Val) (adenine(37)-N6)-methyltransferase n=1 Tax=uncultured Desulfuromusa sp. TaxID=219183 RepID=UPI002AA82C09|nr:tRNA1(Val) (adenine(37)-N6)-methyltransferase [uncultured Desulfuromusa sp.]
MKETLDTLSIGNLQLLQAKDGYRYSLDPVLLARFVNVGKGAKVVDLGTGSGILPLILARLSGAGELTGIEIQPALAERAGRNVRLNGLQDRVNILHQDIRDIREAIPGNYADLVVSNPPYRHPDSGRIAPNSERAAARHEISGGLVDFIAAAAWLLKQGGHFAVIYLAERLPELMLTMAAAGLEPKRLRMVHPQRGKEAKMVLVEGGKGGRPGLRVEDPLYVYVDNGEGRNYTEEILQMYDTASA